VIVKPALEILSLPRRSWASAPVTKNSKTRTMPVNMARALASDLLLGDMVLS
jgi:hypothetical protein